MGLVFMSFLKTPIKKSRKLREGTSFYVRYSSFFKLFVNQTYTSKDDDHAWNDGVSAKTQLYFRRCYRYKSITLLYRGQPFLYVYGRHLYLIPITFQGPYRKPRGQVFGIFLHPTVTRTLLINKAYVGKLSFC